MGTVGVEPTRGFPQRCLRPPRLPFRHVPRGESRARERGGRAGSVAPAAPLVPGYAVGVASPVTGSRRARPSRWATSITLAATVGATLRLKTLGMM